jgi:hypothetical protein
LHSFLAIGSGVGLVLFGIALAAEHALEPAAEAALRHGVVQRAMSFRLGAVVCRVVRGLRPQNRSPAHNATLSRCGPLF